MFNIDRSILEETSQETGFIRDNLEKVYRLIDVLEFINGNEYLKERLALKGGTAINLTVFDLPRLSVDIDLDFCGNYRRSEMLSERQEIESLLIRYMTASGYSIDIERGKDVHALDSWAFSYINTGGNRDNIKVEINYSMRNHILPITEKEISLGFVGRTINMTTLDTEELFASKIKALIERTAARDLYDIYNMISSKIISEDKKDLLRKSVLFYRTVGSTGDFKKNITLDAIDKLTFTKIRQTLLPVLRKSEYVDLAGMQSDVKNYLEKLLVFTPKEQAYVEKFMSGKYAPELLFDDVEIIERIKNHPMALWKTRNIAERDER